MKIIGPCAMFKQQISVAEAVYFTPWMDESAQFKAAVRLMMVQAQNPTRLNAWKMFSLGLGNFVEVSTNINGSSTVIKLLLVVSY